jgi:hypothetical protein
MGFFNQLYTLESLGFYETISEAIDAIYAYGDAFGYDHGTNTTF